MDPKEGVCLSNKLYELLVTNILFLSEEVGLRLEQLECNIFETGVIKGLVPLEYDINEESKRVLRKDLFS